MMSSESEDGQFSPIANYYAGKSVFVTGASGFLGKVLVEKLLRSCPEIETIFVLLRDKKGKTGPERVSVLLHSEVSILTVDVYPLAFSSSWTVPI
jgi:fatty acyl-CoA reductase